MILNIIKTRLQNIKYMKNIIENKENQRKNQKERKELIECINIQYLTIKSLKEYINMIEEEDIKGEIWKEFKKLMNNNLDKIEENQNQILKKEKEIEEQKSKEGKEDMKKWKQLYLKGDDNYFKIIEYSII